MMQILHVTLVVSDCLGKELLKCVLVVDIALVYAVIIGMTEMPQWSADN